MTLTPRQVSVQAPEQVQFTCTPQVDNRLKDDYQVKLNYIDLKLSILFTTNLYLILEICLPKYYIIAS